MDANKEIEIELLPTESSRHILKEIIKNNLKSNKYSLSIKKGSKAGDNYLGIVFRVEVISEDGVENLSIIAKLSPQDEVRRKQFFAKASFDREILFYDEIFPLFYNFQKKRGINVEKEGFHHVPKCFKTNKKELEEGIYMNDLKVEGFEMFDRHQEISFEHCRIVLKILGKLHAISFAIKDQEPELMAPYSNLKDLLLQEENENTFDSWFAGVANRALGTLDEKKDAELLRKLRKLFETPFRDLMTAAVNGKKAEPYSVLCQGDCWNNNILFKNENGVPVGARLLDWQIIRYASPVCDLLYFLFPITTQKMRDQHYETFLKIYHQSFSTFLKKLGSNPEKLFPFKALENQFKMFGRFGVLMSILMLPIVTTKAEDVPNIEELARKLEAGDSNPAESFCSKETEHVYKEKMREILRHFDRLGFI